MSNVLISGYASLDYPVGLDGQFVGDQTTVITARDPEAWPRPGGCPSYVGFPLARAGHRAAAITWIGTDREGQRYKQKLAARGLDVSGIATIENGNTPISLLVYQQDRSCGCLFDRGMMGRETLTTPQKTLAATADLLCITVGPPQQNAELLEITPRQAIVAWVLKNHPGSFPSLLTDPLSRRLGYAFCTARERPILDRSLQGKMPQNLVIVETKGPAAVSVQQGSLRWNLPVQALDICDTTGAGDTLAGGFLAAVLNGETDPVKAARAGIAVTQQMLLKRVEKRKVHS